MAKPRAKAGSAAKTTSAGRSRTTSKARSTQTRLKAATPAKRRSSRPAAPAASRTKASPAPKSASKAPPPARGQLRERLAQLSGRTTKIAGLKRSLHKSFFDVGVLLNEIRAEQLYEVKGYGSFEAFLDREVDINKVVCLRTSRIAEALTREAALSAGLERASAAVAALDGESSSEQPMLRATGTLGPVLPLHKQ